MADPTPGKNDRPEAGAPTAGTIDASFSTLAVSLGTQAVVSMGIVENPMTGKQDKDMQVARFNIDLLRMLRDKTQGNLNEGESKLLNDMIYDLQMKFVQESK